MDLNIFLCVTKFVTSRLRPDNTFKGFASCSVTAILYCTISKTHFIDLCPAWSKVEPACSRNRNNPQCNGHEVTDWIQSAVHLIRFHLRSQSPPRWGPSVQGAMLRVEAGPSIGVYSQAPGRRVISHFWLSVCIYRFLARCSSSALSCCLPSSCSSSVYCWPPPPPPQPPVDPLRQASSVSLGNMRTRAVADSATRFLKITM